MSNPLDPNKTDPLAPALPGELTLSDLEKLTPDFAAQLPTLDANAQNPAPAALPGLQGDVLTVQANIDSSYASVSGAIGTTGNEASAHLKALPINLQHTFP